MYNLLASASLMTSRIIGIYSPAPHSGKTLASNVLTHQGFTRLSFAAPLKRMCIEFLMMLGYSKAAALEYVFTNKEALIPEINQTPRHLMQTLGTEWGRNLIDNDVWLTIFEQTSKEFDKIVVDDVRFPNEAEKIKQMGGEMWKVVRPSASHNGAHSSEGQLDGWNGFDHVIYNDGTLVEFREKVDAVIKGAKGEE